MWSLANHIMSLALIQRAKMTGTGAEIDLGSELPAVGLPPTPAAEAGAAETDAGAATKQDDGGAGDLSAQMSVLRVDEDGALRPECALPPAHALFRCTHARTHKLTTAVALPSHQFLLACAAFGGANHAVETWEEVDLPTWLRKGVRQETGLSDHPFKAQMEVFKVCDTWSGGAASGGATNLLATAANGSGKTMAFGVPALKKIDFSGTARGPQVLILSKTVEGCLQQNKNRIDGVVSKSSSCADSPCATYDSRLVDGGRIKAYPGVGGSISMERTQVLFGTPKAMATLLHETVDGWSSPFMAKKKADAAAKAAAKKKNGKKPRKPRPPPKVIDLFVPYTFPANPAHNLTRPPSCIYIFNRLGLGQCDVRPLGCQVTNCRRGGRGVRGGGRRQLAPVCTGDSSLCHRQGRRATERASHVSDFREVSARELQPRYAGSRSVARRSFVVEHCRSEPGEFSVYSTAAILCEYCC